MATLTIYGGKAVKVFQKKEHVVFYNFFIVSEQLRRPVSFILAFSLERSQLLTASVPRIEFDNNGSHGIFRARSCVLITACMEVSSTGGDVIEAEFSG